jgi:hypothetical protein
MPFRCLQKFTLLMLPADRYEDADLNYKQKQRLNLYHVQLCTIWRGSTHTPGEPSFWAEAQCSTYHNGQHHTTQNRIVGRHAIQEAGHMLTWRTAVRYFAGSLRNALASEGLFSRRPSNSERAKVRQWSMLCGKECTVHMGACFSGGSLDAPAEHKVVMLGHMHSQRMA